MAEQERLPLGPYRNKRLFSNHYLDERLPRNPEFWADPPEYGKLHGKIRALYEGKRGILPGLNEAQTESEFIRPVLELLGFSYVPQTASAHGRPDLALFADEETKKAAYLKMDGGNYADAVGICEAKYWERPLDLNLKNDPRDLTHGNPNFQIVSYLTGTQVTWGVLTNGRIWRLYSLRARPAMDTYYEIDLVGLLEKDDLDTFKYFLLLFRREAFVPGPDNKCLLDRVFEESERYRVEVEEDLRGRIGDVLRALGTGFVTEFRSRGEAVDEAALKEIYSHSLILMYRILFILYAEDRNLLPMGNTTYKKRYSFVSIRNDVQDQMDNHGGHFSATRTDYYDTIRNLCHAINTGDESVEIPPYNGGLFNPANYPFLETWRVADAFMAKAIDMLARRPIKGERHPVAVDYKDLSERQLGSIYESLLEFHLVLLENGGVDIRTDKGERKATGSYYTPDYIVKYIVENTLGPLVKQAAEKVKADKERYKQWTAQEKNLALKHYTDIKVLDPSMGSGHFLLRAIDFIAEAVATDPEMDLLHEDLGVETRAATPLQEDPLVQELKRLVVENCIFGVDLNGLAVELAKLSLWLATLAKNKPLNFLDHHLRCGNSLVGARLHDLGQLPELKKSRKKEKEKAAGARSFAELAFTSHVADLLKYFNAIENLPSDTVEQVHEKERSFEGVRKATLPFRQTADAWTSAFFGSGLTEEDYGVLVHEKLEMPRAGMPTVKEAEKRPAVMRAMKIADEKHFFHWELEFPEIFFGPRKENPGFDAVIGNPPYKIVYDNPEKQILLSQYFSFSHNTNWYTAFIEKTLLISRYGGFSSLITPNTYLRGSNFANLREIMCKHGDLVRLLDFGKTRIFLDPEIGGCAIYVLARNENKSQESKNLLIVTVENHEIREVDSYLFNFASSQDGWNPQTTLLSSNIVRVADCADVKDPGFNYSTKGREKVRDETSVGKRILYSRNTPQHNKDIPFLKGEDFDRYTPPHYRQHWLKHNFPDLLTEKDSFSFSAQYMDVPVKLIYRQTADRPRVSIDYSASLVGRSVHVILTKGRINPLFLMAVLNSKFIAFQYMALTKEQGRPFAQVKVQKIEPLPIPAISFTTPESERRKHVQEWKKRGNFEGIETHLAEGRRDVVHDILAFLAEEMTRMHKEKQEEMQGFLNWLEGQVKTELGNLSGKTAIQDYPSAQGGAEAILTVLAKNKKKLGVNASSRDFQENFIREYEKSMEKLKPLMERIKATDKLIDQIVYRLYGLTPEEIAVVEGSAEAK